MSFFGRTSPRARYVVTFLSSSGARFRYPVATRSGKLKAAAVAGAVQATRHPEEPIGSVSVRRRPHLIDPEDRSHQRVLSGNYWTMIRYDQATCMIQARTPARRLARRLLRPDRRPIGPPPAPAESNR